MKRAVVILSCLALVGVTLMPACYVPCCCKTPYASAEAKTPACCQAVRNDALPSSAASAAGSPDRPVRAMHACCSGQVSEPAGCCDTMAGAKICSNCRCLEQLQIVALPGLGAQDPTSQETRGLCLCVTSDGLDMGVQRSGLPARSLCGTSPPPISIPMLTCVVLC